MELICPQGVQHHSQVSNMFNSVFGVNKDIVHKYHHKLAQMESGNSFHKIHKGREGIAQFKRYHGEFIVTKPGPKCSFGNVLKSILS